MGTPDASFGLSRVLEALLQETYPRLNFEVVNAAMTAVNSHVVNEIARSCARLKPDLFVIYMGNNEVVGPFGPGTIFRDYSPNQSLIRGGILARKLRLVQFIESGLERFGHRNDAVREWRGLEMFLGEGIPRTDPRLEHVYAMFEENLEEIIDVASRAGASSLLSTVASNLSDSPPFGSMHGHELSRAELSDWTQALETGLEALGQGDFDAALRLFETTRDLDPEWADTHFLLGKVHEALEDIEAARSSFEMARDLDIYRFRADGEINRRIRRVATSRKSELVRFVDLDEVLGRTLVSEIDTDERANVAGAEIFVDHVHFRFLTNYALARRFLPDVEALLGLPEMVSGTDVGAVPSLSDVAELLALTAHDRYSMAATIVEMTARPPFSDQLGHAARQQARRAELRSLSRRRAAQAREIEKSYRKAISGRSGDILIRSNFATYLQSTDQHETAVSLWQELIQEVPDVAHWHRQLGFSLARGRQWGQAMAALENAQRLEGGSAASYVNIGTLLELQEEFDAAADQYRKAIGIDPFHREAHWNLALLLEKRESFDEAEALFRKVLDGHPTSAPAHSRLAEFLDRRDHLTDAIEEYRRALEIRPDLLEVRNNFGVFLERLNRFEEAEREYGLILAEDPTHVMARFNLADVYLANGRYLEAIDHYRTGLQHRPSNVQARLNLARALQLTGDE